MPNQYDPTSNYHYAQPTYDSVEDEIRQQRIREAGEILEESVPSLPTRD